MHTDLNKLAALWAIALALLPFALLACAVSK